MEVYLNVVLGFMIEAEYVTKEVQDICEEAGIDIVWQTEPETGEVCLLGHALAIHEMSQVMNDEVMVGTAYSLRATGQQRVERVKRFNALPKTIIDRFLNQESEMFLMWTVET